MKIHKFQNCKTGNFCACLIFAFSADHKNSTRKYLSVQSSLYTLFNYNYYVITSYNYNSLYTTLTSCKKWELFLQLVNEQTQRKKIIY